MAEIDDVVPGADVLASWGNLVRDRVVMRYTTQTALETAEPAAADGSLRWADDTGLLIRTGGVWEPVALAAAFLPLTGGTMSGAISMGGQKIQNVDALEIDGTFIHAVPGQDLVVRVGGSNIATFRETSKRQFLLSQNGTSAGPALGFTSDDDTGMYRVTTNQMGFTLGGALTLLLSDTDVEITGGRNLRLAAVDTRLQLGASAMPTYEGSGTEYEARWNGNSGYIYRGPNVSSLRKLKKNIAELGLVELPVPVSFQWRKGALPEGETDEGVHYSFIQDDLPPEMQATEASPDLRAILAAAVAHIHDLTARLEALEAQ